MTTISICIPFHLRGERSNWSYTKTFRYYSRLPYPVYLCGSEGVRSSEFARPFLNDNTFYVEVPQGPVCKLSKGNDVLRQKFNDSLAVLPDTYWRCLVGADDIVSEAAFTALSETRDPRPMMAGVSMDNPLYIYTQDNGATYKVRIRYARDFKLLPGLNAFNREAMRVTGGNVYAREGCETGAEILFEEIGIVKPLPGSVTMVKGVHVLNSIQAIVKRHKVEEITPFEIKEVYRLVQ